MNDNYNYNLKQNYKNKKEMSFTLKDIPQTIQLNQDFEDQDKRIEINDEYNDNPIEINLNPEIIEDKDNILIIILILPAVLEMKKIMNK